MTTALIFVILEILQVICLLLLPQAAVVWTVLAAICPLLLLIFAKKPTLAASQNVYATVFSLMFATLMAFCGSSCNYGCEFVESRGLLLLAYAGCVMIFALLGVLVGLSSKRHYMLFALGVFLAVAHVCVPQNSFALWAVSLGLLGFAVMFTAASATSLHKRLARAAKILDVKNVSTPLFARNFAFAATAINLFFVLTTKFCEAGAVHGLNLAANIVCAVLDFVLLFAYLYQPLETVSEYQLDLLEEGDPEIDLESVRTMVTHRLSDKKMYLFAAWLRKILPFFFHDKIAGLEKVTEKSTVFVANHYEIYGPFITELKFARKKSVRPWTDSLMTNRSTLTRQLRSGVDKVTRKWLIKPIRKKLPSMLASTVWNCIDSCRPISIYRRNQEKIDGMMNESVAALKAGDSILIFPEKPPEGEYYKDDSVDKFQTGFVAIAEKYKQETGKDLTFFPLYIDKRGKKMIVGERVTFDGNALLRDEKVRVTDNLFDQLSELAQACAK